MTKTPGQVLELGPLNVPALAASLRALAIQIPACRRLSDEAADVLEKLAHALLEELARAARALSAGPRGLVHRGST